MKIVFAAGGTGGHINPALAVAGEVRSRYPDAEILFVGTAEKLEAKLVPEAGFGFSTIEISGFSRKLSLKGIKDNILTVKRMFKSTSQVKKILQDFKPDAVMGFGGYVSGPVVREAAKLGIPTAIHEQNAYPGVANKALASKVDKVLLTVAAAGDKMNCKNPPIVTGLPVRSEILTADREISRRELGVGERILILSMGGSLGAKAINEAMLEVVLKKHDDKRLMFIHGTGKNGLWFSDRLAQRGFDASKCENVQVREYIDDMARCMSAADIVVGRAGASSLSEIEALGKASVLTPFPAATENHQYHNAMALVNNNAAIILEEKDLTGDSLAEKLDELIDSPEKRNTIGKNAAKMANLKAKSDICDILLSLVK